MPKTLRRDERDWMFADQVDCLARLKLEACCRAREVFQASEKPAQFQNSAERRGGRNHGPIQFKMIAMSAPGIRKQKQPGQKLQ